jgi:hypothetical protein
MDLIVFDLHDKVSTIPDKLYINRVRKGKGIKITTDFIAVYEQYPY